MKKYLKIIFTIILLPAGYFLGGLYPWPSFIFERQIQITSDLNLPEDSPFYKRANFSAPFSGKIDTGSKCTQTLRKGSVIYIKCGMQIHSNAIKYIEKS